MAIETQGLPGGSRADYYDRNSLEKGFAIQGNGDAPHSTLVRGSYTVPTGKKAFVSGLDIMVERHTAATAASRSQCVARRGSVEMCKCLLWGATNNAGDRMAKTVGTSFIALEGTTIDVITNDVSTGGTVNYYGTVVIMEFDG